MKKATSTCGLPLVTAEAVRCCPPPQPPRWFSSLIVRPFLSILLNRADRAENSWFDGDKWDVKLCQQELGWYEDYEVPDHARVVIHHELRYLEIRCIYYCIITYCCGYSIRTCIFNNLMIWILISPWWYFFWGHVTTSCETPTPVGLASWHHGECDHCVWKNLPSNRWLAESDHFFSLNQVGEL